MNNTTVVALDYVPNAAVSTLIITCIIVYFVLCCCCIMCCDFLCYEFRNRQCRVRQAPVIVGACDNKEVLEVAQVEVVVQKF